MCGLPDPLLGTVNVPVRRAMPAGPTKLMVTVQVVPGFLVVPEQVSAPLLNAVLPAVVLATVEVPNVTGAVPPIVIVTVLDTSPARLPNSSVRGTSGPPPTSVPSVAEVNATVSTPVPERATVCGLPVAVSVTVNEPLLVAVVVGEYVTVNVQVPATGTVEPEQVSPVFAKGAVGFEDELNVTGATETVTVTVSVAVVPTGTLPKAPELNVTAPGTTGVPPSSAPQSTRTPCGRT